MKKRFFGMTALFIRNYGSRARRELQKRVDFARNYCSGPITLSQKEEAAKSLNIMLQANFAELEQRIVVNYLKNQPNLNHIEEIQKRILAEKPLNYEDFYTATAKDLGLSSDLVKLSSIGLLYGASPESILRISRDRMRLREMSPRVSKTRALCVILKNLLLSLIKRKG